MRALVLQLERRVRGLTIGELVMICERALSMLFCSISIFTSVIIMPSMQANVAVFLAVAAVVIVHIMSLSVLLAWDNPNSLFGKGNYKLNRYYATHTMHVHKLNKADVAMQILKHRDVHAPVSKPLDFMHWDALGVIVPAVDEIGHVRRYHVGRTQMERYDGNVCDKGPMPACLVENNAGDYLLLNGETLSILSEISPSVYFATLLTIYLLCSVPFVASVVFNYLKIAKVLTEEWCTLYHMYFSHGLKFILVLVYFCGLISAYGGSAFRHKTIYQLKEDVYYSTSSHMASILVCAVVLFLYLLHLRNRNNVWDVITEHYKPVPVGQNEDATEDGVPTPAPPNRVKSGLFFFNGEFAAQSSCSGAWNIFTGYAEELGEYCVSPNGPLTSEGSVLAAITIFLGGMGTLGMSNGVVLDVEAQLVLASVLGFAVLAVCSHRIDAFFWFISGIIVQSREDASKYEVNDFYYGINLIQSVVLVLQLWLVLLYNNTLLELEHTTSAIQQAVFAVTILYYFIRVFDLLVPGVWQMWLKDAFWARSETWHGIRSFSKLWWIYAVELLLCGLSFFVVFAVLFAFADWNGLHAEDSLEQIEKLQYALTGQALTNVDCKNAGKYSSVDIVNQQLHSSIVVARDWNVRNAWTGSTVDPVDLKIFFWTKFWNVDFAVQPSLPAWFCKNGYEHHWMQCRTFDPATPLPPAVQSAISAAVVVAPA